MRTLVLVATLIACRTVPYDRPIDSDDFGSIVTPVDMSVRRIDLAAPMNGGCTDLLDCINGCLTQDCQNQCFMDAPPQAQNLLTEALDCIYSWCQVRDGTRPPRCDINFNDEPDAGDGTCDQCITNAYASLGG